MSLSPEELFKLTKEFTGNALKQGAKPDLAGDLEGQGWEKWLMTIWPHWFAEEFSDDHRKFWAHFWRVLQEIKAGKKVAHEDLVMLIILGRGLGKSAMVEAARIMRGAILGKGYGLIISETDDQAQEHLGNARGLCSGNGDSRLLEFYPDMAIAEQSDILAGMKSTDKKEMFSTKSGYILRAKGLAAKMRGLRVGTLRPDDLCHEIGTKIFVDDQWMNVEDHPTARIRQEKGITVQLCGIPFTETVTREHRYWVKDLPRLARPRHDRATFGWVEAKDLHARSYVGLPIDMTVEPIPEFPLNGGRGTIIRDGDGEKIGVRQADRPMGHLPELEDPEWWWAIGLWWGDGHLQYSGGAGTEATALGFTIARKQPEIYERLQRLATKYGRQATMIHKNRPHCFTVQLSHGVIARWLYSWKRGNSIKTPPLWVERIDIELQKHLIRGYLDADGHIDISDPSIRLTSVNLDGLMCVRRILARIGIPASVRNGIDGKEHMVICGAPCKTQKKYDLRFQAHADLLWYDQIRGHKNRKFTNVFIQDGYLWSKVRSLTDTEDERTFVPITTTNNTYLTHFGKSHNCFDDIDDCGDSYTVSSNKLRLITASILPVQARENVTISFAQNLISEHSVINQIFSGRADALASRTVIGVTDAFEHIDIQSHVDETGKTRHVIGPDSIPTWSGLSIDRAQKFLNDSGLSTFMAEYQNKFDAFHSGRVIPEYNENRQIITWSQFEKVYGVKQIPPHWQSRVAVDIGYSEGATPHHSAWAFVATSAQNSNLPGKVFVYRGKSYLGTSIDDQADDIKKSLYRNWAGEVIEKPKSWQISHEKTGEMLTLNQKHNLPFSKVKSFRAEDGVPQWRHLSRPDMSKANPFKPDVEVDEGVWTIGDTELFYIVDDGQENFPHNDAGLALMRDQVSSWEYVPVKVTETGQTVQKPSKLRDDFCDALKYVFVNFSPSSTALNKSERILRKMQELYPPNSIAQHDDPEMRSHLYSTQAIRASEIKREIEEQNRVPVPDFAAIG
jgi:hypothetical protein